MLRMFPLLLRAVAAAVFAAVIASPALAADPLVSPQWLKAHAGESNLVVIDVRPAAAYGRGHVPGAVNSDFETAHWRITRNDVPLMVPDKPQLEVLIGDLGVDETSRVVVVPGGTDVVDFGEAARVYWTLKYAGVKEVSILDGGVAAWKAAGLPLETRINQPNPAIFNATLDKSILAELPEVEKVQRGGGATLVDARPASQYLGKDKVPIAQAYGHIPGAESVDSEKFFDDAHHVLKPKAELASIAGGVPDGQAVTYCNTGHLAATDWFVLHEMLGRTNTKLYDGSMVEWSRHPDLPVASSRTKWDDLKKALGIGS